MATILRFLRKPAVLERRGVSNSTHYDDIKQGMFTKQVALGPNSSGWPEHEVDLLNAARMAGKSDDEIRALVEELHAQRETLFKQMREAV